MPSIKHEYAVEFVTKAVQSECSLLDARVVYGPRLPYGCIPDSMVDAGNNQYIAIEVGYTDANKIVKYLKDPQIKEIRWYSKDMELAGIWNRDSLGPTLDSRVFSKATMQWIGNHIKNHIKFQNLTRKIETLKSELAQLFHNKRLYAEKTKIMCPFCFRRFTISQGKISKWGGYDIVWCGNCDEFSTASDLNDIYRLITMYREDTRKERLERRRQWETTKNA